MSVLFVFTLILTACTQGEKENSQGVLDGGNVNNHELLDGGNANETGEDRADADTPELRGGPEEEVREPTPLDNFKLRDSFPNIVVLRGRLDENKMALSFDDGPDTTYTPAVLDKLNEYDVKATFFLVGERAEAHPEIVERIVKEGHEIANHTWDHPKMTEIPVEEVRDQINQTEKKLHEITGHATRMYRPPYGFQNEELVKVMGDLNYSIIIWSQDSLDWKDLTSEEVADNILSDITPGAIILQHSAGGMAGEEDGLMRTVDALDKVIPKLQDDGTEFVTVSELLNIREYR